MNIKKCLYISNNKALIRNKEMIRVPEFDNLYTEEVITDTNRVKIYIDFGIVCYYVGIYNLVDLKNAKDKIKTYTLDFYLNKIREAKNNNQFINVAEIKLVELSGASKKEVQELIDYRQAWYDRKEKEEQEKRIKRELEEEEFVENKNKELENLVLAAEQAILNKQELINKNITIYKSKYESNTLSLILYMMKRYNINVPLKTQGWINQALYSIKYNKEWGEYSYMYYNTSANSTVFSKYLSQLIKEIQNKHLKTNQIKNINKEEYII